MLIVFRMYLIDDLLRADAKILIPCSSDCFKGGAGLRNIISVKRLCMHILLIIIKGIELIKELEWPFLSS